MSDIKIIDNFLDKKNFLNLQNIMLDSYFPWYFNEGVVYEEDKNFQFTHTFYSNSQIKSDWFQHLNPILEKINYFSLIRIKANLLTKTKTIEENKMHNDYYDNRVITSIFYLNTTNGYTLFENNKKINSMENRIVFFPANILHTGSTCTDKNKRVLININFIPPLDIL